VVVTFTLALAIPAVAQDNPPEPTANSNQNQKIELIDPGKIYNDKKPYDWVGKSVTLKNALVQDTNNNGNFWVGSDDHHRLLIVKPENDANLQAMRVHKGDIVTVSGVVHPASEYMAGKTSAEKGSMNDAEHSSGVFLLVDSINIASSTQH
jgi:hypothetical protein